MNITLQFHHDLQGCAEICWVITAGERHRRSHICLYVRYLSAVTIMTSIPAVTNHRASSSALDSMSHALSRWQRPNLLPQSSQTV